MEKSPFLKEIKIKNLLSFGPEGISLEMKPLNILIGPNGSGKSNLIEAISLLKAAPTNLAEPIRRGGGIQDWIWKGDPKGVATVCIITGNHINLGPIRHCVAFSVHGQVFFLESEIIERADRFTIRGPNMYRYENAVVNLWDSNGEKRLLNNDDLRFTESVLSQIRDPIKYAEMTFLGNQYKEILIFQDWTFGHQAAPRNAQETNLPKMHLENNASNLYMVLNRFESEPKIKHEILENLRQLYPNIEDYYFDITNNKVLIFFRESGFSVPATRLSDGTLRYLCLLTILCDPEPPPLICIEEPELGLHPDIMPTIAKLLKKASERTQLIVTTHSDILVDEFTEDPEAIVVCERHENGTEMNRLSSEKLSKWLEKYRLGELWIDGEIGGVRW